MPESFPRLEGSSLVAFLTKAAALRCPLEVLIKNKPPVFSTRIRDLDVKKKQLEIYTFDHDEANHAMEPGADIVISLLVEGQLYRFQTVCKKDAGGVYSYRLEMPARIEMVQRRAYFRITPPRPEGISLQIRYNPDDPFTQAKLMNLSLGGLLAEDKEIVSCPEENQAVRIMLRIEGGPSLTLNGKIRRIAESSYPDKDLRIGIEFDPVESRDEATLSQIIMSWQRERRREQIDL